MKNKNEKLMRIAIGNTIVKYRDKMGLSQIQLAVLAYGRENAQLTVSKSENAKRNIPCHEILYYTKAFRITPAEFFKEVQSEFKRLNK
jgi:transcriptional regulator with XRE-family HTH domain